MDVLHPRCAGLDVSKRDAKVCVRVQAPGRTRASTTVTTWGAVTNRILDLREYLVAEEVTLVVMEATGDYWRPFYYPLEDGLFEVMLVNAQHVKNVPGRKTRPVNRTTAARRPSSAPDRTTRPLPCRPVLDANDAPTDLTHLSVPQVGSLAATGDLFLPYRLLDAAGAPIPAAACVLRRARRLWPAGDDSALLRDGPFALVPLPLCARGRLGTGDAARGPRLLPLAGGDAEAAASALAPATGPTAAPAAYGAEHADRQGPTGAALRPGDRRARRERAARLLRLPPRGRQRPDGQSLPPRARGAPRANRGAPQSSRALRKDAPWPLPPEAHRTRRRG